MADPSKVWIYHERQEALLCGQHALNNLVQGDLFTAGQLAEVAQQLDALELKFMAQNNEGGVNSKEYRARVQEGSVNVDERGNFSIQVLKKCMDQFTGMDESLPHYTQSVLKSLGKKDVTEVEGFLCHKSDHWFAIRLLAGRFFNLNSTQEKPTVVSHFHLGKEIDYAEKQGYTVFCVASSNLPQAHVGDGPPANSGPGGRWHNMSSLLGGGGSKTGSSADPWQSLTGQGMRLDGKSTSSKAASSSSFGGATPMQIDGLTEEEQLQLALQLSETAAQEQRQQNGGADAADAINVDGGGDDDKSEEEEEDIQVPPEPPAGDANSCRIQFRFPNNQRVVRRFGKSDSVRVLYAFCRQQAQAGDGGSNKPELRAGFPPKDLQTQTSSTLQEAGLTGGESIQVRWV